MPMAPTTYMLLVRPTEGGDDDLWDTELNTLLALVDSHDHTTNKGVPVPSAGLNINADLSLGAHRLTSVGGLAMSTLGGVLSSGANEFFSFGGNAYYRSGGGSNVQITSGGALNMTTGGGFAGDYVSVVAEAAFVNASDGYTFKQQTGGGRRQWARMNSADVRLYQFFAQPDATAEPTNFVGLASPAALAGSYTYTFPAALPASNALVQVSAAGVMTTSNTVTKAVTMTELTTFTAGATANGLITANAGVTAAANQDFTVSGTGKYNYPAEFRVFAGSSCVGTAATPAGNAYVLSGGGQVFHCPAFRLGETVSGLGITFSNGGGTTDATVNVTAIDTTGATTVLAAAVACNNIGVGATGYTIAPFTPRTLGVGVLDFIYVEIVAAATCYVDALSYVVAQT